MVVLSATVGFNARPADVTTGPLDATLYDLLYGYLPIFLARKLSIISNTVSLQASPTDPTGLGVQGRWKVNTAVVAVNVPLGTPGTVYIFADLSNTAVKTLTLVASLTNTPAAYQQLLCTVSVAGGAVVAGSLALSGNVPTDPNTLSVAGDWRLTQGAASPIRSVFTGAVTDTVVLSAGAVSLGGALAVVGAATVGGTLGVTGGATVGGTLGVTGRGTFGSLATTAANTGGLAQEAWTAVLGGVGFQNSWVNFGAPYGAAQFMRDSQGRVWLRGMIKSGGITTVAFTLPLGYRPLQSEVLFDFSSTPAEIVVDAAGGVTIQAGNNLAVSLSGLSFATN